MTDNEILKKYETIIKQDISTLLKENNITDIILISLGYNFPKLASYWKSLIISRW